MGLEKWLCYLQETCQNCETTANCDTWDTGKIQFSPAKIRYIRIRSKLIYLSFIYIATCMCICYISLWPTFILTIHFKLFFPLYYFVLFLLFSVLDHWLIQNLIPLWDWLHILINLSSWKTVFKGNYCKNSSGPLLFYLYMVVLTCFQDSVIPFFSV